MSNCPFEKKVVKKKNLNESALLGATMGTLFFLTLLILSVNMGCLSIDLYLL